MIYILSGNDFKSKSIYLKKICKGAESIFLSDKNVTKEIILEYTKSINLFGETPIIVVDNAIKDAKISFSTNEILMLCKNKTILVLLEDKLLASDFKKFDKNAIIEDFVLKENKVLSKINVFSIANSYSIKDKIKTWILYREAILSGVSPEEIAGIIFWKIKTMILSGTKFFSIDELKLNLSILVSIYHDAHKGETDFIISLEQFILSSLNKNK